MLKIYSGFVISLFIASVLFAQNINRYVDSIFMSQQTGMNVVFGTAEALQNPYAGESYTVTSQLTMHIFEPADDTLQYRPVLICTHGGSFIEGDKEHDDMLAFCDSFATKGYVTATINYRQGMNVLSSSSASRAVYRGIQDGRAAVRFLKEKADEYGIDTARVYFLGSSAGAFIALHNLYMNKESERPAASYQIGPNMPPTTDDGPDLGSLDATGNNYTHDAHPDAVVALWGALQDTNLIQPADPSAPVFLVHGTADDIVPFDVGSSFGLSTFPATYGSNPIHQRMEHLGFEYQTYFVQGAGHEFYGVFNGSWNPTPNTYWDTVVTHTTQFLYLQHKPNSDFEFIVKSDTVIFSDASEGAHKWNWDFGDGTESQQQNPVHIYADSGSYLVTLYVRNEIDSWDTLSANIRIDDVTGIRTINNKLPQDINLAQNYPNPFNPSTTISYTLLASQHVMLTIYNALGQELQTLVKENQSAGTHHFIFDAAGYASGVYFYKLTSGNFSQVRKMIFIR